MCFHYAGLELSAGGTRNAIPPLRRALVFKPDYLDARIELGLALMGERKYAEALTELTQIKKADPEHAHSVFMAIASADLRTGRLAKARQQAGLARKWARTPEQSGQAESLLHYLDAQSAAAQTAPASKGETVRRAPAPLDETPYLRIPVKRLEGKAKRIECSGKSATQHVTADGKDVAFLILDPGRVNLKHRGEVMHDFARGSQQPFPIVVEYTAAVVQRVSPGSSPAWNFSPAEKARPRKATVYPTQAATAFPGSGRAE